jgi:hypothetical protein
MPQRTPRATGVYRCPKGSPSATRGCWNTARSRLASSPCPGGRALSAAVAVQARFVSSDIVGNGRSGLIALDGADVLLEKCSFARNRKHALELQVRPLP